MTPLLRPLLLGLLLSACVGPAPELADATLSLGNLGSPYSAQVAASGGEGALEFDVAGTGVPPGLTLSSSGMLSGTPTAAGAFSFTAVATDAADRSGRGRITVEILATAPPRIVTQHVPSAAVGRVYSVNLSAEGGTQPFAWTATGLPAGLALSSSGTVSGTAGAAGTSSLQVSLVDARGQTAQATVSLQVIPALSITTPSLADAYTDTATAQTLVASGGTLPYSWSLTAGSVPPGLAFSASGTLSGNASSPGSSALTFTVTDADGNSASSTLSLSILAPPRIVTASLTAGLMGAGYTQGLSAEGGRAPLVLSMSGALPPGLTWTGSTLTGTPTAVGSWSPTFSVEDANGRTGSQSLSLTVYDSLAITTATLPTGYASSAYSVQLAAIGGGGPYVYGLIAGSLPAGISLSSAGLISGTTASTGDFPVTVQVTDSAGQTATRSLVLRLVAPVLITTDSLPDAYRGSDYPYSLSANGGEGTLQWTLTSGHLASGMQLSFSGALSGTVDGAASTSNFTLRATDANGRFDEQALTLNVYAPPVITSATLASGTAGVSYSQTVGAWEGKAPLSFSLAAGALPGGLTLTSSSGAVSGTPNAAGSFGFTVQVTDANGRTAAQAFTVEIVGGTGTPAIFKAASWNIEWFGDSSKTPEDSVQLANATRVISESGIDAWGLVEMVSTTQFNTLLGDLPGYAGFLANHASVTSGSAYYTASEQKLGFLYDTSKVQVNGASLILTAHDGDFAGRPPLRVDTTVTVDGHSVDIVFIMVHLKAFADVSSRTKREIAAGHLKSYLDTNLGTREVIVMGDWNDDVDESIVCDGTCMATPFANFVGDATDYRFLTSVISEAGGTSTVSYTDMIDHHLATNELVALHVSSSQVVRPDQWASPIADYGSTTSDHYPVLSRFDLSGSGGGGEDADAELILNEVLFDEPGTSYAAEFVEIRNVGSTPADLTGWSLADVYGTNGALGGATRHLFTGTLAPGATLVVYGGAAGMSGAPSNAVAASSGQLSLHPIDELRLISPSSVIVDSLSFSTTWGDGISANRSTDGDGASGWVSHTSLGALLSSPGTRVNGSAW